MGDHLAQGERLISRVRIRQEPLADLLQQEPALATKHDDDSGADPPAPTSAFTSTIM